jgi:predicted ester cyclase
MDAVLRLMDVFSSGKVALLPDLLAPDFIQNPGLFQEGPEGLALEVRQLRTVLPDLQVQVHSVQGQDGQVALMASVCGTHSGRLPGHAWFGGQPTGRPVTASFHGWFEVVQGRIRRRQQTLDGLAVLQCIHAVASDDGAYTPLPAERLAGFPPGTFLESVATAADGSVLLVSMLQGQVLRWRGDAPLETVCSIPLRTGEKLMCLAAVGPGEYLVNLKSADPARAGVWWFEPGGGARRMAALPPEAYPNGIAVDGEGSAYVADSALGWIWRVRLPEGRATAWLCDDALARRPLVGRIHGANGIQYHEGALFVAITDRATVLRVPVRDGRPGSPVVHLERLGVDDLAIGPDGTLYATTHVRNSVVRVTPDGVRSTIAGPAEGVLGAAAAALGQAAGDRDALYVVGDGGLLRPAPGYPVQPALVRLKVGLPTRP